MTISRARSAKTLKSPKPKLLRDHSGEPIRQKRFTLQELVQQIRPENLHEPIDFGPAIGREIE